MQAHNSRAACYSESASTTTKSTPLRPGALRRLTRHSRKHSVQCRAAILEGPISLPLFPLPTVLHPAQAGVLHVFEPQFLEMFRDLQYRQPRSLTDQPRFGHLLSPALAPPALMEGAVGGLPAIGVAATVKSVAQRNDGTLMVEYEGQRRFRLLMVELHTGQPYMVGAAQWLDDLIPSPDDPQHGLADGLERDVMATLMEVAKYSRKLSGDSSGLPAAVLRYAPPPEAKPTKQDVYDALRPAGASIAMWKRHGSVYGNAASRKESLYDDPYQTLREKMGKERRQELFSFAAASVLEMGLPERIALLQSQDTVGRLQYVLAALKPYLHALVAQASLEAALGH